jgi:predicted secreted Zn-dependent protease
MVHKGTMLALLIPAIAMAQPEPIVQFGIEYYEVSGATTAEISKSIFDNTPVRGANGMFGAVTKNQFSTAYSSVSTTNGGCEVKNVRVELASTVVLPELVINGQSQQVFGEWSRYIGALRAHEMQHANNGKYTANTLAGRLYNFKTSLPCKQMRVRLDYAVNELIVNMGRWDQQLDAKTEHGKSQGAFIRIGFK